MTLLERVRDAVDASADELNRLDAVAGDGDLGISASRACAALVDAFVQASDTSLGAQLKLAAVTIARVAPSTAGTLVASGLLEASRSLEFGHDRDSLDIGDVLTACVTGIAARGRAVAGDKTLLDALIPAADAARVAGGYSSRMAAAAGAAAQGAEASRDMTPKFGRASWTPDRASGSPDAGAALVAIVLAALVVRES